MSHYAFVNPGGPKVPDLAKAKRNGITRLYWQANDPQISTGLLLAIRERGYEVGIMRDPSWDNFDATDLAHALNDDLIRLGADNSQCAVLTDIEYHNVIYLALFLKTWRELRPRRVTGWTLEPLQGGWITSDLAALVTGSGVTCFPQTFRGDMSPVEPDLVRSQLVEAGIPRMLVALCYDGAHIPASWDGIAFRFEQMP